MEKNFKLEIISPEKILYSETAKMVTFPSYEGEMSVLKNHISIITFLRPGIIKVYKNEEKPEEFFVQDGVIEYFNNSLVVLSSSVLNLKELSKDILENLSKQTQEKLIQENITDNDRYILNHKLNVINEIRG